MSDLGRELFKLAYQISPIILVNGIASQMPFQMLPIVAITEAASFVEGLLSGSIAPSLDKMFAHWRPLPGTTLVQNDVGRYPFANQSVAANAIIAQPLTISMLMMCPVQNPGGYVAKLATLTAMQSLLSQHTTSGGTFIIATPSQIFTNALLVNMVDVSAQETAQAQNMWKLDFVQPLITINQATQVYSSLMNKISNGLPIDGQPSWSGEQSTIGSNFSTMPGSIVPSATNLVGTSASSALSGVGGNTYGFTT